MSYFYSHETLNHPVRVGGSPEVQLSENDLFSAPAIQREVDGVYWEKVFCHESGLDMSQDEVIFDVKPSMDAIQLADSYMDMTVKLQKITDAGPKKPTATEKVGITNNVLYSMWKGKNSDSGA